MNIEQPETNPRVTRALHHIEKVANRFVRSRDRARSAVGLQGRKAQYDDASYEFVGGAGERLRIELAKARLRSLCQRCKELLVQISSRRNRPRNVGEVLRIELA